MPTLKSLLLFIGSIIILILSDLCQTCTHWYLKEFSPPDLSFFFEKIVYSDLWLLSLLSFVVLICFLVSLFVLLAVLNLFRFEIDINMRLVDLSKSLTYFSVMMFILSYIQTVKIDEFPLWAVAGLVVLLILSLRFRKAVESKKNRLSSILSLVALVLMYTSVTYLVASPVRNLEIVRSFNQRSVERTNLRLNKQMEVRDLMQEYGVNKRWDQEMIRTSNPDTNYAEKMAEKVSKMGSILFVGEAHCDEKGDVFSACYDWNLVASEFIEVVHLDCVQFEKEGQSLASLKEGDKFAAIVKVNHVAVLKDQSIQSKYREYIPIKIIGTCGKYVPLGDSYLEGESYHPLKTFKAPWAGSGVVYRPEEASLADVLLFGKFLDV